jgi:hypothetical protein
MELVFSAKRIAKLISLLIVGITAANLFLKIFKHTSGYYLTGYRLLDVDAEQTLPAWYSSSMLLFCAGLLAIISYIKIKNVAPYRFHWSLLSAIFFGLSLDEAISLHEMAIVPVRSALNLTGLLYFSWIIPGSILVIMFALLYLKFLIHLPKQMRNLFLLSGTTYVLGAIGVEMVGGMFWESVGSQDLSYQVLAIVEELFEMSGINIFIYALLSYLFSYLNVRVYFKEQYSNSK